MLICVNVITSFYSFSLALPLSFSFASPLSPAFCLHLAVRNLWHFEKVNATPCCSEEVFAGISKGLWQRYDKRVCVFVHVGTCGYICKSVVDAWQIVYLERVCVLMCVSKYEHMCVPEWHGGKMCLFVSLWVGMLTCRRWWVYVCDIWLLWQCRSNMFPLVCFLSEWHKQAIRPR